MRSVFMVSILALILSAHSPVPEAEVCLHPEEKRLYDLLMAYRKTKDLEAIPLSAKLTRVAQLHAKDLSENYNPDNKNCNIHSWSKKGNWKSCCYTNDHKRASCMWGKPKEISGYESNGFEISYYNSAGANAEGGLAGWRVSLGHNRVIIDEGTWATIKWKAIGIGIYKEYGVVWFGQLEDEATTEPCK